MINTTTSNEQFDGRPARRKLASIFARNAGSVSSTNVADAKQNSDVSQGVSALPKIQLRELPAILFANVGRTEIAVAALVAIIVLVSNLVLLANDIVTSTIYGAWPNTAFTVRVLALIVVVGFFVQLLLHRLPSPSDFLLTHPAGRKVISQLVPALIFTVSLAIFMSTFAQVKSSIPVMNDYTWDDTFIRWDTMMHGKDPWRILQPVLGIPSVSAALGRLYHLWFALIHIAPLCIALYLSDKQLKLRFFLGYFLTWTIVGMISATALASVGPVFLEPLLGNAHFADQMAYLHAANDISPNPVIEVQDQLLLWYNSGDFGIGRGITAMPSMHVALTTLYVFAMWQINRRIGILFAIYWVIIAVASVHLAYHYAVDGYVSLILVSLIWFATKPLSRLILGRNTDAQDSDTELAKAPNS